MIGMKNVRFRNLDLKGLEDFAAERKYPLMKSDGSSTMEYNVSYIFKRSLNMRQMMQLAQKKQHVRNEVGSLKNSSGTIIAVDVDRDVKYYLYEMADHFATHGALRCLFNGTLLVEILAIKGAPSDGADFNFPDESTCPVLCAAVIERDSKNHGAVKETVDWIKTNTARTRAAMPSIYLSYDVSQGVYDTILSIAKQNTAKLSPSYVAAWKADASPEMKAWTPTFFLPLPQDEVVFVAPSVEAHMCSFPGCGLEAAERCGRCRVARYCGAEHQRLHWKAHKLLCKPFPTLDADSSILIPIQPGNPGHAVVSNLSPDVMHMEQTGDALKGKFVIKVQPSVVKNLFGQPELYADGPLMIYNAKRTLLFQAEKRASPDEHARLLAFINKSGIVTHVGIRCKAYFYAKKEEGSLRVFVGEPCEAQEW